MRYLFFIYIRIIYQIIKIKCIFKSCKSCSNYPTSY